jgi:hypothetical protein
MYVLRVFEWAFLNEISDVPRIHLDCLLLVTQIRLRSKI